MTFDHALILLVVAATLSLILIRPRGISEAWIAAGGALAMLVVSPLALGDLPDVLDEIQDVLLFLLGMMVLTHLAEHARVFEYLAESCARMARGNGIVLFCNIFFLGAIITALLSLDVTVIMLTPIVYTVAIRRRLDAIPFLFACTFVANTASLVLPISNLTNLLVYHRLEIGFGEFAATMWLPNLAAAIVNLAIFLVLFRHRLPRRFDLTSNDPLTIVDWWFVTASVVLAATLIALLALGLSEQPLAPGALGGGAILLAIGLVSKRVEPPQVLREISWPVFVFVVGMFLVVRGIELGVLADWSFTVSDNPTNALFIGSIASALGSNIVNNVPMTLLMMSIFDRTNGPAREAFAYGTLVGSNIGPTLTTYGSLATMLWLTVIRKRGIVISTRDYLTVGLITMPPVLIAATVSLWLV
ncbi:MAG: ArsB/NhaD family transporter, partial [Thermomicrobiales bacterium]